VRRRCDSAQPMTCGSLPKWLRRKSHESPAPASNSNRIKSLKAKRAPAAPALRHAAPPHQPRGPRACAGLRRGAGLR
jgi:hypothetical protein